MRLGMPKRGVHCNRLQPPCGGVEGCGGVDFAGALSTSTGADSSGAEGAGAAGTLEGVAGSVIGALGTVDGACAGNSPAAAGAAGCSAMTPRFCWTTGRALCDACQAMNRLMP